jgi:hypothetical protein
MRATLRRGGRWFSPVTLALAGLCFLLPFVTVSCDTPGGFGRATPGGTSSYTGMDLVVGGEPEVTPPDRLRPLPEGQNDRLWPQPTAIAVLAALVVGVGFAVWVRSRRSRRGGVAVVATASLTALLVNQALVEGELTARVAEALTAPLPAGRRAEDFVQTGTGFVACATLLVLAAALNAIGWWRVRGRPVSIENAPIPGSTREMTAAGPTREMTVAGPTQETAPTVAGPTQETAPTVAGHTQEIAPT